MRTVIGLFENTNEAKRTIEDLKRIGVRERDISVISRDGVDGPLSTHLHGDSIAKNPDGVRSALVAMGLSEDEANRYVAGFEQGYTLETAAIEDNLAPQALAVMTQHSMGGRQPDRRAERGNDGRAEEVLPIVVEELDVGKREVQAGGVRAVTKVSEQPVEQDVRLREERVEVERRKANRPVTEGDAAFEDRVVEVRGVAEEPVVTKSARVVEDVVLKKDTTSRTEKIRDKVRRTDVDVQPIPFERERYRADYASNYAPTGASFDDYEPAYRYGHDMRANGRYADNDWSDVEPDARADWEKSKPNTWERFKAAVRHAFEG